MRTPAHLINQDCVITSRSQTGPDDQYGTPTWTESDSSDLIYVQPVNSEEIQDRPAGRYTHRGFLRPTTVIGHADKVTLASGQQWEVDGPPRMFHNPRSRRDIYQIVDLVGYTIVEDEEES